MYYIYFSLLRATIHMASSIGSGSIGDKDYTFCIGDSITTGAGSSNQFYNYPSQLSRLLNGDASHSGVHYDVINLGKI